MTPRRSEKRNGSSERFSVEVSEPSEGLRTEILSFIAAHLSERGYAPSMREIGKHVARSPQAVMLHLDALEASGHLTRTPGIPRSLRLMRGAIAVERLLEGFAVCACGYLIGHLLAGLAT